MSNSSHYLLLALVMIPGVFSMSLLDAYKSERAILRRQGQANVRFRPIMHLNGNDDWRKQLGVEELTDQIMDENGIVYDLSPTANDRLTTFFNNQNPHARLGRK